LDKRVVLFSGGVGSFQAAYQVLAREAKKDTQLWFFDTLVEDEDLYRFLDDCEEYFSMPILRFADGRTPWDVFRDERFIGNTRATPCNRVLKIRLLHHILRQRFLEKDVVLCFGLDATESARVAVAAHRWAQLGYQTEFPLTETSREPLPDAHPPFPRLYELGFTHNNCGGACVKAGIRQWVHLFHTFPKRYSWHAEQEASTRKLLRKDVAILRDRRGGITRPLTLRDLQARIEAGWY